MGDRTLRIGGTRLDDAGPGADAVRADLRDTPADGAITVLLSHRPDTVLALPGGSRAPQVRFLDRPAVGILTLRDG